MENIESNVVYHGSPSKFDSDYAMPKQNTRESWDKETSTYKVIFDQISFHATPHKWIALAYTYRPAPYEIDGKTAHYNMGVSLYENTKQIAVLGFNTLQESLRVLYGEGGYVYHFDKEKFVFKDGLGNLEVIAEQPVKPIRVERIDDPVAEMMKFGVKFKFIDLALPEYEGKRNYY